MENTGTVNEQVTTGGHTNALVISERLNTVKPDGKNDNNNFGAA